MSSGLTKTEISGAQTDQEVQATPASGFVYRQSAGQFSIRNNDTGSAVNVDIKIDDGTSSNWITWRVRRGATRFNTNEDQWDMMLANGQSINVDTPAGADITVFSFVMEGAG